MLNRIHRQYLLHHRRRFLAVALFLLASIASLWSWNTLAELFAWPQAEYRHALAALAILYVIRRILFTVRRTPDNPQEVTNEYSTH